MDIEVLDACERPLFLEVVRGWRAVASDPLPVKRQGTEVFENPFVSHRGYFPSDGRIRLIRILDVTFRFK